MYLTILSDWIATTNGIITLITGALGLIGTAIGMFFAIKNWISLKKNKSAQEIWESIMNMADAAMQEAEKSGASGADKKQIVINAVTAGLKADGLDISGFLNQLSDYIDQCISFANGLNGHDKD